MRGRYQPIGSGGGRGGKVRWGHIAVVVVLLVVIVFVLLAVFGTWNIATYFQHLFFPSSSSVKVCPGIVGLAFELDYDPSSGSVVSTSDCATSMSQNVVSGGSNAITPYYSGQATFAFDMPGCTAYSWTQWISVSGGPAFNTYVMKTTPAFPLQGWVFTQGWVLWSAFAQALPSDGWVHVAMVYDPVAVQNYWYFNGQPAFQYDPVTHPPAKPYLVGSMSFDTLTGLPVGAQISLGRARVYCQVLLEGEVVEDMDGAVPTPMPLAFPVNASTQLPSVMPSFDFPFVDSTSVYQALWGDSPTVASDNAVPRSLSSSYTTIYVDQVGGNDATGVGTSTSSAWASIENLAVFGNLGYVYASLSSSTLTHNGVQIGDIVLPAGTQPLFASLVLPGGCNAWYVPSSAGWGQLTTPLITKSSGGTLYYNGLVLYTAVDGTSSFWINLQSVTGSVQIGLGFTATAASGSTYTLFASMNSQITPLTRTLSYDTYYHLAYTWNCVLGLHTLYLNGVMVQQVQATPGQCTPIFQQPVVFISSNSNWFAGHLGAITVHLVPLSASAVGALYRLLTNGVCSIAEMCLAVRFCAGDRYFASPGIQLAQGTLDLQCPTSINSIDCGRGSGWAQIHGQSILPQTPEIGWQPVAYTNPVTNLVRTDVLAYDLHALWTLTGTDYLRSDPLAAAAGNYAPSVFLMASGVGTAASSQYALFVDDEMYLVPRAPNVDSTRWPYGHLMQHSLKTYAFQEGEYWTPTPWSWCNFTFVEMCNSSIACYAWLVDSSPSVWSDVEVYNMPWTYSSAGPNPFLYNLPGSSVIDCTAYFAATGYPDWTSDASLLLLGVVPGTGVTPQCTGDCVAFTEYFSSLTPSTASKPAPPSRLDTDPLLRAAGGWSNQPGVFLKGPEMLFDGPCESIMKNGVLYAIPCNAAHRAMMLDTSSGLALDDPISIAQNPALTAGWARAMDLNTVVGISVGLNPWQLLTSASPVQAIVQGVEVSGFNRVGIAIQTYLPSRVYGVTLSHNLNHIVMTNVVGDSFVIQASMVNVTRPLYGFDINDDGSGIQCVPQSPQATCNILDSVIEATSGQTLANVLRNVSLVDNVGQAALNSNGGTVFWIEHSLFNLTEQYVGDAGTIYTSPTPEVILYTFFDGLFLANPVGLDPEEVFLATGGDNGGKRYKYNYGTPMANHGVAYLHVGGDPVGLSNQYWGYDDGANFYQLTSSIVTGGSYTIWDLAAGLQFPTTAAGARGRPYGLTNTLMMYDAVLQPSYSSPWQYPAVAPGVQGNLPFTMWRWGNSTCSVDGGSWVVDTRLCYGNLELVDGATQGSYPAPGTMARVAVPEGTATPSLEAQEYSFANAPEDWLLAVNNQNEPPGIGSAYCEGVKDQFLLEIGNEAFYHYWLTQPAVLAIARYQIPALWLEPYGVSSYAGIADVNPSSPQNGWPADTSVGDFCSSPGDCAPFLLTQLVPDLSAGTWTPTGGATLTYNGFDGQSQYTFLSPSYVGVSYDNEMGAVLDTSFAAGLSWTLTYPSTQYTQFTLTFWLKVSYFGSAGAEVTQVINRDDGTLLDMNGNDDNTPGGTIRTIGQGINGQSGSAVPYLDTSNSPPCYFDSDVNSGLTPPTRAGMDQWTFYAVAVSQFQLYSAIYLNGTLTNPCVAGDGVNIQPIFGGSLSMTFLNLVSARIANFSVYAGALSPSAIQSLFEAQQVYPYTSFPILNEGTGLIVDVHWTSEGVATAPLAALNQFTPLTTANPPDGSGNTVTTPQAQFSLATPPGLTAWSLSVVVWFASFPSFQDLWSIPVGGGGELVMAVIQNSQICLLVDVGPLLTTTTINAAASYCLSITWSTGAWHTLGWVFSSGGATLFFVDGTQFGTFLTTSSYSLTTGTVLQFSTPPNVYLAMDASAMNRGYVKSVQIFQSID